MFYKLIYFYIFFSYITCATSNIFIYSDEGVYLECIEQTRNSIESLVSNNYIVKTITADEIKYVNWQENTSLIIFPGGIATFYANKLNGIGNQSIKTFVQNGGNYLGFCGGAYYAAKTVDFAKGTDNALFKSHELSFFAGTAIGPALKAYDYSSNNGECVCELKINFINDEANIYQVYHNGGGYFDNADNIAFTDIIASYNSLPNKPAAIIKVKANKGNVVLSGAHIEYPSSFVKTIDPTCDEIKIEKERNCLLKHVLNIFNIKLK